MPSADTPQHHASAATSELFSDEILQHLLVQTQVSDEMFETLIFFFQL